MLDRLTPEELERTKEVTFRDIYGSLEQQRKVVVVLSRMLEIREEELMITRDHKGSQGVMQ